MSKGESTKVAILDEATRVAARVGFEGLTIGQLADQAGMSKSGLFAHFKSKEQLQLETLDHARARFVDRVIRPALATDRGIKRVRALFAGWIAWASDSEGNGCPFVAAAFELDDQPGPLRDALVRNEIDWLEIIASVTRTAVTEGDFRVELDVDQFAYEVHGVMLAHHHATRLLRDGQAGDRTRAAFESLVAAAQSTD